MESKKKINVGISKTDIGYFVDLHHTIIAGSYSPVNTALKDYTTDVETLNYALKPLNLEIVEKQSNPTLSECIKEWETLGYEFKEDQKSQYIFISSLLAHLKDKHIHIFLKHSTRVMFSEYGEFTTQELMLLVQTLKALEVENEK